MEKSRKLSLKRKRPQTSDTKQTVVDKKYLKDGNQDEKKPVKIVLEKSPILKEAQILIPTVDPALWQQMPKLPTWGDDTATCTLNKQTQGKETGPRVEIQISKDVQICWTPLPPFCKQCLIRGRPRKTGVNLPHPEPMNAQNKTVCGSSLQNNNQLNTDDSTCSSRSSVTLELNETGEGSGDLRKSGPATDQTRANRSVAIVAKQGNRTNNDTASGKSRMTKSNVSTVGQASKKKPASWLSSESSENESSDNLISSESESLSSKTAVSKKKFVPFSASRPTKPATDKHNQTQSNSSSFLAGASKQKSNHLSGPAMRRGSNTKDIRSLASETQTSNFKKENITSNPCKEALTLASDEDPLGGLTDEDLIVILSSDEEEEFQVNKPAVASKVSWNPSKNDGKKDTKGLSQVQKGGQKGKTKQSKASSQKSKAKVPTRTIFDYAKATPPPGSVNQHRPGTSGQGSNWKTSKQQSGSIKTSSHGPQGRSGNQKTTKDSSGGESSLQSCPLCQVTFQVGWSQLKIDGHIAACLAGSTDDVMW